MTEIMRRFKLMNRKYLIGIAIGIVGMSLISRLMLTDRMYLVSCVFLGLCAAGLYYSLVKK